MKVALVHDYLREFGGAERVVEVLHEMYPDAPLYTSFVDWESLGDHGDRFKDWNIRTTWVQKNYLVRKFHSPLRFLTPLVWESIDLNGYDVVISSSGWFMCRGIVTRPETLHISYIHHPPRNLYGYPTGTKANILVSLYGSLINPFLRMYDFAAAQRVDYLVANSEETKRRIQKYYRRDSEVIYPPVGTNSKLKTQNSKLRKEEYYLSVGRLTYAKRVDLAIEACNKLKLPLKIVGQGKEEKKLKSIAGPTIDFVGPVDDSQLSKLYQGAKALIFCALQEDFGMVPVEAMSYGVPVVALRQGGVIETVIDGETGLFFDKPKVDSLISALKRLKQLKLDKLANNCLDQAAKFSKDVFKNKIRAFIESKLKEKEK